MYACDLIELELFQIGVCLVVVVVFPVVLWRSRIYDGSIKGADDIHTRRMLEDSLALGKVFVPLPRTIRPGFFFVMPFTFPPSVPTVVSHMHWRCPQHNLRGRSPCLTSANPKSVLYHKEGRVMTTGDIRLKHGRFTPATLSTHILPFLVYSPCCYISLHSIICLVDWNYSRIHRASSSLTLTVSKCPMHVTPTEFSEKIGNFFFKNFLSRSEPLAFPWIC